VTATVPIPFDVPHTVTVRKLNARQWANVSKLALEGQRIEYAEALVRDGVTGNLAARFLNSRKVSLLLIIFLCLWINRT